MKLASLDLRILAAIMDCGGISPAARKLGLQKSSISRDLAALEERLGARLLERTTRRLRLTEAGEILMTYARRVGEELENAEIAMESLREAPRGALIVSAPYSFVLTIINPSLREFHERYPDVRVALVPTAANLDLISDGIDLAIRIGDLPASNIVARKLARFPLILVAAPDYLRDRGAPETVADLRTHNLIDLRSKAEDTKWSLFDAEGVESVVPLSPKLAAPEPMLAMDLAERGHGVATLPSLYAMPAIETGRLARVLPAFHRGTRPIHALFPSRRLLTPKVRVFLEFLVESVGALARLPG